MLKNFVSNYVTAAHLWPRIYSSSICELRRVWFCSQRYDDVEKYFNEKEPGEPDVISESELDYFTDKPKKFEERSSPDNKPIKYTLAATNMMLFGPLLETKPEKTKRLKREEKGINEEEYQQRRKKSKKKKTERRIDSIISRPENFHYFDYLGDSENKQGEKMESKLYVNNLKFENEDKSEQKGRLKLVKKLNKYFPLNEVKRKPLLQGQNSKKIIVLTGQQKSTFPKISNRFIKSETEASCIVVRDERNMVEDKLDLSLPENNKIESKLISIDNSNFSAAPSTIDINLIRTFPLFNNEPRTAMPKLDTTTAQSDITTIGIFDGGYQKLPSVRKILDATMPLANKIALDKWKAKMIKELGEDGFEKYRQGLLERGKLLHGCIESQLGGVPPTAEQVPLPIAGFWTSIKHVLPSVSEVQVLESRLIHPYLYYQGAVDCIGMYKGIPMLIEWKTSTKPKLSLKSMFDDPLQVVAYLGAFGYDGSYAVRQPVESAMLVVAYGTGLPAHIHIMGRSECEHYWKIWCDRLAQFWGQLSVTS